MQVLVLLESCYSPHWSHSMGQFREGEQQRMKIDQWKEINHHFSCRQRTAYCETFFIKGRKSTLENEILSKNIRKLKSFFISWLVLPEQITTD